MRLRVALFVLCLASWSRTPRAIGWPAKKRAAAASATRAFDLDLAVLCASKSFQAYVTPQAGAAVRVIAREKAPEFVAPKTDEKLSSPLTSDATSLALCWHSRNFVQDCFLGELVLELESIRGLKPEEDLGQKVLTGAARDLYVIAWLSPNSADGRGGKESLAMPFSVARSATKWRLDETEEGVATLGGDRIVLPIPADVAPACTDVVLLLMDENVGKDDEVLGHTKLPLNRVLVPAGRMPRPVAYRGELLFKVAAPVGPGALGGAVIGGVVAGPVGAAVGAGAAAMLRTWKSDGKLRLRANFRWAREDSLDFGKSNLDIMTETAEALGKAEEKPATRERTPYPLFDATRGLLEKAQQSLLQGRDESVPASEDGRTGVGSDANARGPSSISTAPEEALAAVSASASASLDRFCGTTAAGLMVSGTIEEWKTLCANTKDLKFELLASIDEIETDTQCVIWRSEERKEVILAFRGTEQDKWRDLVTDATLVQERWEPPIPKSASSKKSDEKAEEMMCHAGFKRAYMSVRDSIRALVCAASLGDEVNKREAVIKAFRGELNQSSGTYRLVCTGHSLGGALATMAAADLVWSGAASHFKEIDLYTYGAPRVGNRAFCEAVNKAVPTTYRIVNGQDVIARLPRGALAASLGSWRDTLYGALDYSHPGIPVLVDERQAVCEVSATGLREGNDVDPSLPEELLLDLRPASDTDGRTSDTSKGIIVGKDDDEDIVDSRSLFENLERDPFRDPLGEGSLLEELSQEMQDVVSHEMEEYQKSSSGARYEDNPDADASKEESAGLLGGVGETVQELLGRVKRLQASGEQFDEMRESLSKRLSERLAVSISQEELLALVGVRREFLDAEIELLRSITTGLAVTHHLEPSYFVALKKAKELTKPSELAPEEVVTLRKGIEP